VTAVDASQSAGPGAAFMLRLRLDHAGLSRVLRTIDSLLDRLPSEPDTVLPILADAFDYLLRYQHAFHHPREDRLFARIQSKRPSLEATLERLGREHVVGEREAGRLAEDLGAATADRLRGPLGAELVNRIREYVAAARVHMRNEEAVFYVRAETALSDADWSKLLRDGGPGDPLEDAARLARDYPELAAYLGEPVRRLGGGSDEAADEGEWHGQFLALTDVYGGLLHEGVDLTRKNLRRLLGVRGPIGLAGAVGAITSDNLRFAGACLSRPSRWVINAGAGWLSGRRRAETE
jgi:hemerythrin-like domain-containing protein